MQNNSVRIFRRDFLTVSIFPSTREMGFAAAGDVTARIIELLKNQRVVNMIFAAAPSQDEFLNCLVEDSRIAWRCINAFHMDEYIGLPRTAPQSFGNFLDKRIFDRVPFKSVNYLNGKAADIEKECERYTSLLAKYPPDIICLGIGENGHIAFNDPGIADFNDPRMVKKVVLDAVCRQQQVNEGCFKSLDDVPATALTLTIPALMKADHLFCVVPFKNKADAVHNTLFGDISEQCPATILRQKENSCLYLNTESAKRIINLL